MLLFADASAWIALLIARDSNHGRALEFFRSLGRRDRLCTSNYVLSETYTWLAYRRYRRAAGELNRMVSGAEKVGSLRMLWVERDVHDKAWDVFQRYDDQAFSFCDCTTAVLCQANQVDFVFGFDRDFLTMGLDLKPGP